jgi:hypothetical protein
VMVAKMFDMVDSLVIDSLVLVEYEAEKTC